MQDSLLHFIYAYIRFEVHVLTPHALNKVVQLHVHMFLFLHTCECGVIFLKSIIWTDWKDVLWHQDLGLSDIATWSTICACLRHLMIYVCSIQTAHSPTVFVFTRIYVSAPIRLRWCIWAAWIMHPCSLISLCHVHGIAVCLCAS